MIPRPAPGLALLLGACVVSGAAACTEHFPQPMPDGGPAAFDAGPGDGGADAPGDGATDADASDAGDGCPDEASTDVTCYLVDGGWQCSDGPTVLPQCPSGTSYLGACTKGEPDCFYCGEGPSGTTCDCETDAGDAGDAGYVWECLPTEHACYSTTPPACWP